MFVNDEPPPTATRAVVARRFRTIMRITLIPVLAERGLVRHRGAPFQLRPWPARHATAPAPPTVVPASRLPKPAADETPRGVESGVHRTPRCATARCPEAHGC